MSLILDALRRADSERERDSVPGLHAQPVPPLSVEAPPRARAKPWYWIAIGVVGGLLVSLSWYFIGREAPRQASEATVAETTAAPVAPVVAAVPRASPTELQPVAEPAPWPVLEKPKVATKALAAVPAAGRTQAKVEQPADPKPAEPTIYSREQLPENIRAGLPQLAFGGSIYSTNAANRSLIINGRIYRENDQLTADLSLEQIKLKAAVLKYKGYLFEVQF